jgi:nicotinate dehydrogenase subunit A
MAQTYTLTVNGSQHDLSAEPDTTLLHVLRHALGLTRARFGCGMGLCGACVVLIDGHPTPSCDTPMWSVAGKEVTRVEGLARDGALHPLQEAFLAEQAAQCGYCTSGILVSASALLAENPRPPEPDIVAALDRHLCRCGVYGRIVRAVVRAGTVEATS